MAIRAPDGACIAWYCRVKQSETEYNRVVVCDDIAICEIEGQNPYGLVTWHSLKHSWKQGQET